MKKHIFFFTAKFIVISAIIYGCSNTKNTTFNEQVTDSATIRSMINAQTFVFVAQYVNPMGLRRRFLTDNYYDVSITKDSIISFLPYFGRAYTAPISPTEVDFDFTSKKFTYSIKPGRKGWNISIKPTDQNYLQELYFTIFNNGSASLNVNSINKSFVSYDGYIAAKRIKEPKKK